MFEVRVGIGKNRLYFTMSGTVSQAEARAAADQVIQEVARLRPGFDTLSSISGLEPFEPAALQFERLSRSHGYSAHLAFSLAEAEHILDERR